MIPVPKVPLHESANALRYVARQPILNLRNKVLAYELLFRAGPEAVFRGDGDMATRTMLDNAMVFGLERLSAGLPAFVNCTMESLVERMVRVLPAGLTVLEVLETLEPTPELIAACRELKAEGYRIALDDFVWKAKFDPLVELADYIKVDFIQTNAPKRQELFKRVSGTQIVLLAEKVETQEDHKQARAEGFTLFQGYYFCRPQLVENRKVPANKASHVQILRLLQHDPLDLPQLSELLKRDTSLVFRFLRMANSATYALHNQVRSIHSALQVVGDDAVRRIASLAIASELNAGQSPEILRMALVRGRFCELAARASALEPAEQYLLGMFSLLSVMLGVPMATLAPILTSQRQIQGALLGALTHESSLLRWVEFHEQGNWAKCDVIVQSYGLNQAEMIRCYAEAAIWTDASLL
ncbi:MAG: HDOD domain-containing protein [Terracidiphilus sp.]|jgi:EAL and modified HD-GYP domain-containing signal transduction protein